VRDFALRIVWRTGDAQGVRIERLVAVLLTPLLALGCGGAAPPESATLPTPNATEPAALETVAAAAEEPIVAEPVVARPAPAPHSPRRLSGDDAVNCDYEFPREDVPDEPTLFTSGPLRVRAQSLVLDRESDSPSVMYCAAAEPLPTGSRLVVFASEYGDSVGIWDGRSFLWPTRGADEERARENPPVRGVVLPRQTVTAVREMSYCPVNPSRACLAAGDFEALVALSPLDPHGPRSGWDFTERALRTSRARSGGRALTADACGLRVSIRGATDCEGTSLDEVSACLSAQAADYAYAAEEAMYAEEAGEPFERLPPAPELVFSDGARELAVNAYDTARVSCVEGVLLLPKHAMGGNGSSLRGFNALEVTNGRIVRARRLTIVDHEEASSDCGNAWDGVDLLPIVGSGVLIGSVVRGAGASPRFDVSRGDVGEATFVAAEEDREYGTMPLAYRVTPEGLAPIETTSAAPAITVCPFRVSDEDGQTNVRPDPSTRRDPVGTIPTGTEIQTVEQRGRWYRIEAPVAGWLWSGSLSRRCTP
jgi:hypothetical protein